MTKSSTFKDLSRTSCETWMIMILTSSVIGQYFSALNLKVTLVPFIVFLCVVIFNRHGHCRASAAWLSQHPLLTSWQWPPGPGLVIHVPNLNPTQAFLLDFTRMWHTLLQIMRVYLLLIIARKRNDRIKLRDLQTFMTLPAYQGKPR